MRKLFNPKDWYPSLPLDDDYLREAEEFDDFDYVDDFNIDDDSDYEEEDSYEEDDFINDEIYTGLKKIASNLGVSGRIDNNDEGKYIYSLSKKTKVVVEFYDEIDDIRLVVRGDSNSDKVNIDCLDDTTEVSNLCDDLTTAIMLIKEIQNKLM